MTEPLILQARAQAGIDDVRQALTDPKALNIWLGEHSTVDLPGTFEFWGRYIPEGDAPHQRVLAYDDRTLRLAWLLDGVETTEITVSRTFDDFDQFWSITTSIGTSRSLLASLPADEVGRLRERVRASLPADAGGRISYEARANAIKGRVPSAG